MSISTSKTINLKYEANRYDKMVSLTLPKLKPHVPLRTYFSIAKPEGIRHHPISLLSTV